jgi:transcriptional regulator with XRE-family HTH domain
VTRVFDHQGIRERRIAAGMTQAALAFRIRRTKGQVENLEAGRSWPSVHVLLGLAETFECEPGELFIDATEPASVAA